MDVKKLELQAEIQSLNRQRDKALEDLEQLQQVRQEATASHAKNKKNLNKELDQLRIEKGALEESCRKASKDYQTITKDLESYGKNEISKAEEAVKSIYTDAQITKKQVDEALQSAKDHQTTVDKKEKEIEQREASAYAKEIENKKEQERIDAELANVDQQKKDAQKAVSEAEQKVYTLNSKEKQLQANVRGLNLTIQIKEAWVKKTDEETSEKIARSKQILSEANAMKDANEVKEDILKRREKLLVDRRETLDRGFNELRAERKKHE